jgi:uncharacterized protein DUF5682
MQLFPVRHHSPRASAVLRGFLDAVQPQVVLVEGPVDATPLVEVLVDRETEPPVAILGFRTDGTPGSSLWPFASYSPEYVAIQWAQAHGRTVSFIDIPTGTSLASADNRDNDIGGDDDHDEVDDPGADENAATAEPTPGINELCAERTGFRSFEEFWEASFEAPQHDAESFRTALVAYADLARIEDRGTFHRARDAFMSREIDEVIASGVPSDKIAVVLGAAHAAALATGDVDRALEATLPVPVPTSVTLIPYSFPRLARQLGYGAGNRAPQFYQRAHDAGCDYHRATLEALITFTEHLRLRGFAASLADTIEAYRLAVLLADIRGKAGPGLDEVREAAVATMCRGDAKHIDSFLWSTVVGRHVGRVASRIGRNALQEEFWREIRERRLPATDAPESFALHLNNDVEVGTSMFLHRLRIAGIAYATYQGTRGAAAGASRQEQAPGGFAALSRAREMWEAQWTPATDVGLVERIVYGNSLQDVATRKLDERLQSASTAGEAAEVLVESVIAACPQTLSSALQACDTFAAVDDDMPSLARACRALSGLAAYGTSRSRFAGDSAIPGLCQKTFSRAMLRVRDACTGNDEAVEPVREALRTLHDVALSQPLVDKQAWIAVARDLVQSYQVNPMASGLACGLLYLAQAIDEKEISQVVGQRLSNSLEPEKAASFLTGFLDVNALVIVKNRPVVEALDTFLQTIEAERFRNVLPTLRRAFAVLGSTERRYLLENVLALRNLSGKARAAGQILDEKDIQKLKDMKSDLSKTLDELEDLL